VNYTQIRFASGFQPAQQFRTGVSLHGHTLHSKESLAFIYHLAKKIAPIRFALEHGEARYRAHYGSSLDLSRAWWTPPLSAYDAWKLETGQIRERFGMDSLVSLSDHDDIEAPVTLQLREECRPMPISVEWTVPYGGTFFHIGVHNLPAERARAIMSDLAAYTNGTAEIPLRSLMQQLTAHAGTLVIFNHANWDENGVGQEAHRATARHFAATYGPFLHAFELNGLRPWSENRTIFDLAKHFGKPLISGGDRHGNEPNTILNLTNATTFDEFVEEIRDGVSDILITNQYLEPLPMRILQNLEDILGELENHAYGWKHWSDRAFYVCADGVTRSLSQAWGEEPLAVRLFTRGLHLLRHPQFKNAFRMAFAKREEVVL
jgi:hypothetical protein